MQAEFNQTTGRLSFSHPDMPATMIQGGVAWVRYRCESGRQHQFVLTGQGCSVHVETVLDVHGMGTQRVIRCPANPDGIELIYRIKTYEQRPFLLLQLSLLNQSREPVYLQDFCLFQAAPSFGGRVQINAPAGGLRFFKVGWHGWDYTGLRNSSDRNSITWIDRLTSLSYSNPVTAKPRSPGEFWSEGWAILVGEDSSVVAGFASTAHQFGQVYACTRPGEEALMLVSQMDGIRLDPGESSGSEWGYLQFAPMPNPQPEADFVEAVARQMRARVPASPPPPMWTHWYHFYHDITEQLFLQNLEVLADMHESVPYRVVELDDGYQSAWGDWTSTNDKFPRGLRTLAGEITDKNLTPGLWLAPFVVQRTSQIATNHPDWLVKDQHRKPANAGFVYNMFIQALDLTHPAVIEHIINLLETLTHQWGYGMLKVDFTNAAALPGRRYNPKLTRAEGLRIGLEAIRQGAGEETFLLASGCPFGPAIGVVDAMRIGPDTAPSWEPFLHWLPWVNPLVKKDPSMPSLRNALRNTLNMSSLHQRWWWNDPDCLLVRDTDVRLKYSPDSSRLKGSPDSSRLKGSPDSHRLTEPEVQSAVTLVGLSGGMLVSSDDMSKVNPERLSWVSLLVPNLGLRGLPLDGLRNEMPSLYQVKLNGGGQAWQLVALFNWNDHPSDCHLRFNELGYKPGTVLHVFDFWAKKYQRTPDPEMVFAGVPPHGCKLLRICEVGSIPQLVGDTLHISQGAEISSMRLEEEKLVIETVDMNRRVEGELWLSLPKTPTRANCNGEQVVIGDKGEGVFALYVGFIGKAKVEVIL
jgi:alpha-galactosidase